MASLMFSTASDRVRPSEMQPGKVGHSATNTPSSSGSTCTRNFMGIPYELFPISASVHPRSLSTAMTDRSSYKIGIGSHSGSSMQLGLAIRPMAAADVNRLHLFGSEFFLTEE